MREIKFRAWDKEEKEIQPVWSIGFKAWDGQEQSYINYIEIERDGTVKVDERDVILMQYTGLKDKNGKEIYEGDVVSTLNLNYFDVNNKLDRQACIDHNYDFGVVEYMEYPCQFMLARRQYDRLTDQWNNSIELRPASESYELEIIGNIYENPELIKEE